MQPGEGRGRRRGDEPGVERPDRVSGREVGDDAVERVEERQLEQRRREAPPRDAVLGVDRLLLGARRGHAARGRGCRHTSGAARAAGARRGRGRASCAPRGSSRARSAVRTATTSSATASSQAPAEPGLRPSAPAMSCVAASTAATAWVKGDSRSGMGELLGSGPRGAGMGGQEARTSQVRRTGSVPNSEPRTLWAVRCVEGAPGRRRRGHVAGDPRRVDAHRQGHAPGAPRSWRARRSGRRRSQR